MIKKGEIKDIHYNLPNIQRKQTSDHFPSLKLA